MKYIIKPFFLMLGILLLLLAALVYVDNLVHHIIFEDKGLASAVADSLHKYSADPAGKLYSGKQVFSSLELATIRELDASGRNIKDISGIEHLKNLERLNLRDNFVKDLSPLKGLKRLVKLNLRNNEIICLESINFHSIRDLKLKELNLRQNVRRERGRQQRLSSISLLQDFKDLQILDLRDNFITDISPLKNLYSLRKLDLSENRPPPERVLGFVAGLEKERDNNGHTISMKNIAGLTNLETLKLRGINTGDQLFYLAGLYKLEHLDLRNCSIRDIAPLGGLTNLKTLNLRDNQITDIGMLSKLTKLSYLNLRGNAPLDIAGISGLINLKELILRDVPAGNILENISGLINLERLNLRNCQIKDLAPLENLLKLKDLNLRREYAPYKHSGHGVKNQESLSKLIHLRTLDLQNVPIHDQVHIFINMKELQSLNVINSGIEDKSVFDVLISKGGLTGEVKPGHLFQTLQAPEFSHATGWYSDNFELSIFTGHENAVILYTLDGSEPVIEGTQTYTVSYFFPSQQKESRRLERQNITYIYKGPVLIHDRTDHPNDLSEIITTYFSAPDYYWKPPVSNIFKAFIVRARAYYKGKLSPVITKSYFISNKGASEYTLPVLSISTDPEHLFGFDNGIYIKGRPYYNSGRTALSRYTGNYDANYLKRTEIPVHFELFTHDRNIISQNAGMRIHGGSGRILPIKSFRLYARHDYDKISQFDGISYDCPFFIQNQYPDIHKRLLFRQGGNKLDIITDSAIHTILSPMKIEVQRSRPVVHFFNGEYWGIINMRDRQDRYYLSNKYRIDPANIIILDAPQGLGHSQMVKTGHSEDILLYRDLYNFAVNNDMSVDRNYAHIKTLIDIESYIDYNIAFIYWNNIDWHGNKHFRYWRVRDTGEMPFQDGKWRMMVWDFDLCPYNADFDFLSSFIDPEAEGAGHTAHVPEMTALLVNLLESREFKYHFINRFADHINSTFSFSRVTEIVTHIYSQVEKEIDEHYMRWDFNPAPVESVEKLISHARDRPFHQRQHLIKHFDIPGKIRVELDVNDRKYGHIIINSLALCDETPGVDKDVYPWKGIYFKDIPIKIRAVPAEAHRFIKWDTTEYTGDELVLRPANDISLTAIFAKN